MYPEPPENEKDHLMQELHQYEHENKEQADKIKELEVKIYKITNKYTERLGILKSNHREKIPGDNYPYIFDIKNHQEILRDLKKLSQPKKGE